MSCQFALICRFAIILSLVWLLPGLDGLADEVNQKLQSGPRAGEQAIPYHPLLASGSVAGQRWCMVCTHRSRGNRMVIVFTRTQDTLVNELVVAIEGLTKKHKNLGGIITFLTTTGKTAEEAETLTGKKVVYLNDHENKQWKALREFAMTQSITNSSLNIYTTDGPSGYSLSPKAAVTVLVADSSAKVMANVALRQEDLTSGRIKAVIHEIETALVADRRSD